MSLPLNVLKWREISSNECLVMVLKQSNFFTLGNKYNSYFGKQALARALVSIFEVKSVSKILFYTQHFFLWKIYLETRSFLKNRGKYILNLCYIFYQIIASFPMILKKIVVCIRNCSWFITNLYRKVGGGVLKICQVVADYFIYKH